MFSFLSLLLEKDETIRTLFALDKFDKTDPLVQNVRVALEALKGAWIKVYETKKPQSIKQMQKVQGLILEGLDQLDNNLRDLSNITVTIAAFGPLGAGKSYVLNHLLHFGLDTPDVTNLLPSGEGDSQTPIPVRIKFDEEVRVTVKRKANTVSELRKPTLEEETFGSKELNGESLKSVHEKVREVFNNKQSLKSVEWLELKGPFPVFEEMKSIIAPNPKHPDVRVDVEFVDLPGCGDETGNPLIGKEIDRANILLLFQAGRSGRPITAEDIAGVFRRRQVFEYPSRPKFIYLVNDQKDAPRATLLSFEERLRQRRAHLAKSWEPLFEENLDESYKVVLEKLPRLMDASCLQKMKEESEVVIFEPQDKFFLQQIGEAVARHVADVQIKKEVHPVVDKMFRVVKRLRARTKKIVAQKRKRTRIDQDEQQRLSKYLKAPTFFFPETEENEDEEDKLCTFSTDDSDPVFNQMLRVSKTSDISEVNTQLCNYLFCREEVQRYLSTELREALEDYSKRLLENAEGTYQLSLNISSFQDVLELLCQKRVEMFMKEDADQFIVAKIKMVMQTNLLGGRKSEWRNADENERMDLLTSFLKRLLEGVFLSSKTRLRGSEKRSPLLKFKNEMHKDVQELIRCNPYGVATSMEDLSLIIKKLDIIVSFCLEMIREINPHPSLDGVEIDHNLPFDEPKALEEHASSSFKPFDASQTMKKLSEIVLKKKKGNSLRELEKALKLPKDALRPPSSQHVGDPRLWAQVLLNVLSGQSFLGNRLEETNLLPVELQVERGNPEVDKLFVHARRRLFAFEQSKLSCNFVQDEGVEADEIQLIINPIEGREGALQAKLSSKLQDELEEMQSSLKDPKEQLAPIFIPTIRVGPDQSNLGNFYLVEDPWSQDTTKECDSDHRGNDDHDQKADEDRRELKANIFVVVEPRHVEECKSAMSTRPPPAGSNISLRYIVLPQNGRGIGVARSIIKVLAECLKLYIYWTIDDDIKFLYQFDTNERRWRKCSFGRALLFVQRVFQHCRAKAVNDLDETRRDIMADEVVDDKFPRWTKATRWAARKLLLDNGKFEEVLRNPSLLHSPFSDANVRADCGDEKEKEMELRQTETVFVEDCKLQLYESAFLKVAGVSIAHQKGRRSDYVSKLTMVNYRRSEQRYQMVLNNTDALKGHSFVQDHIVLKKDEEYTVEDKEKRNTPFWGCKRSDKSFSRALAFYGVSGYQVVCFDHEEMKLQNIFGRIGESWRYSQEPCDNYEDGPFSSNE